ncbi:unnamed protein product [Schistosoma rodhaini]|nr:unnamed protein product [Schistosoma rodhaini]
MSTLKLEDPTVDVGDIEKYRMAFLMQFFVQHKRRFRFPRLRLQDLYQKVLKDPDPVAFCDLAARILRFLNHDDPDICMATLDQALDRFAIDKRTSYRINMQRHRNGKLVHQLGPAARAALLDNLIESVYDEQPDFNFTTCFNSSISTNSGGGVRGGANGSGSTGLDRIDAQDLFGSGDLGSGDGGNVFAETEDVNVLIKAGQDAQGCSYYYMDDLRLYRERPQNGISSQWDVVVGPTADQWLTFIMSLSRNEKEYDLYCFLKQDLFELVKESLDALELHTPNSELDSNYLRTKELNELTELKRRQLGINHKSLVENDKLSLNSNNNHHHHNTVNHLNVNGPKSASPAFSGGHGISGIGSSGSSTSGAPLTPSSARTPTSAPPASSIQQQLSLPPPSSDCLETLQTSMKTESSSGTNLTKIRTLSGQSPCCDTDSMHLPKSEVNVSLEYTNISSSGSVVSSNHHDSFMNTTSHSVTSSSTNQYNLSSPSPVVANATKSGYTSLTGGSINNNISNTNETIRNSDGVVDQTIVSMQNNSSSVVCESITLFTGTNTIFTTTPAAMCTTTTMSTSITATTTNNNNSNYTPTVSGIQLLPSSPSISTNTTATPGVVASESLASWSSSGLPNSNSNMTSSSPSFHRDRKLPTTINDNIAISTQPPSSQVQQQRSNNGTIEERNYRSYPSSTQQISQNQMTGNCTSKQSYPFDSHMMMKGSPVEIIDPINIKQQPNNSSYFRHMCTGQQDINSCSGLEHSSISSSNSNSKQCIGPTTALVSPIIGIPDNGCMPLTQEQWENRKSKIAQLEKIHSTLSKSKSASTPGAITAATAGAVLQQRLMRNSMSMQPQQQSHHHHHHHHHHQQQQLEQQSLGLGNPSAQLPPSAINNSLQYSETVGTRPVDFENYGAFRQSGSVGGSYVNNESAQQEWDRLCSDYQRGKSDPSIMRYSGPRQMGFFDMSNCPVPPHEANLSSQCPIPPMATGTMMLPSEQVMLTDQQTCQPPAYQSGPPVVMVPPNNSNICSGNPGYPSSDSLTLPTESCRTLGPIGAAGPDPITAGVVPTTGQKRSYHSATSSDIWLSPNSIPLSMSPIPNNENPALVGHIEPGSVPPVCRAGQALNVIQSPVVGSIPSTCVPITNTNQSVGGRGSGVTKPGTKKRKAGAASGRSSVISNTGNYAQSLSSTHQQSSPTNQNVHCLKQPIPNCVTTPNKPMNPSYIGDELPMNHFSRSTPGHPRPMHQTPTGGGRSQFQPTDPCVMHYSDMICGPNSGQIPVEQQSGNMEMMMLVNSRHAGTPKSSGEPFPGGTISPSVSCSISNLGSRTGLNCNTNYGPINNYGNNASTNKPMNHPYFNSPDMMGPNPDSITMRTTPSSTPCTQHLTSASLASLARLSQMSGPEGPYIPSCSASFYNSSNGNSLGSIHSHTVHSNRGGSLPPFHLDGSPVIPAPPQGAHHIISQGARNQNSSPGNCSLKSHLCNPNQSLSPNMTPNNCNLPHSQSIPINSKFNPQGYPHTNPQLQPTLQQQQPQNPMGTVTNCGSSLPSPLPNLPTPSQQQPPSIQVNNTFFNAQLNVQQMNYQHVSAPGSTGQMQIHFAQQQPSTTQHPVPPPSSHEHLRSVRQSDNNNNNNSTIRMTNSSNEYTSNNHPLLYNTDEVNHHSHHQRVVDCPSKSEIPGVIPSSSVITSSVACTPLGSSVVGGGSAGYGNASIQITPRTPHTIQYLPTVAPQVSNNQGPSGISPGPNQIQRSSSVRSYQYMPSDIDNNNNNTSHVTDNSIRHPTFQSNHQSYPTNQNIPGQFYNSNQHHYSSSSQSVIPQTYPSSLQGQSKHSQITGQFPGGGRHNINNSNNSTFGWNDTSFDSNPLGLNSLTASSTNETGFKSSNCNHPSQPTDNRLGRSINHPVIRDTQMNYSACSNNNSNNNSDILSTSMSTKMDPSTDIISHQMFTNSSDIPSVQQRVHMNQHSQQYLRHSSVNDGGKPQSYSSSSTQQPQHHQSSQIHQQYYHHQQQHHQMMMSSSSMCDYSGSSSNNGNNSDWSSTNQVQFVMSNSTLNSTMYSSHSNNIVDNISVSGAVGSMMENSTNIGHTTNANSNSSNSTPNVNNSNHKRPSVVNPMNGEMKHNISLNSHSQHHALPSHPQQSQQMMMVNNNNNSSSNNSRSNWYPHQSTGNQMTFTSMSSSSASTNASREMYSGQMHNTNNSNNTNFSLNTLPSVTGNHPSDTSFGTIGMVDNNNNGSGNRSILRQSQDTYDNSLPISSMSSSSSSTSSTQPYSSSVV